MSHSRPLIPLLTVVVLGTVLDHLMPMPLWVWWGALVFSIVLWAVLSRRLQMGSAVIFASFFLAAGAWHHARLQRMPASDIANFAADERTLCRVRGTIDGDIHVDEVAEEDRPFVSVDLPRTRFFLRAEQVMNGGHWEAVRGRVAVTIAGDFRAKSGASIEMVGWLSRPRPPNNPGEFHFRAYLASLRCRAFLFADLAESISILSSRHELGFNSAREGARQWSRARLHEWLSPSSARLADAFLLGSRSAVPDSEIQAFVESGTIHVLVVSGLHVGLLASLIWFATPWLGLRSRALLTILVIVAYAYFAGAFAPAVRAAVLSSLLLGGYFVGRRADGLNSLAASAMVVLAIDPADLFRTGAQLSFLCAFGILALVPLLLWRRPEPDPFMTGPRRISFASLRWVTNTLITATVLWLLTAPLVMSQFHLASPISIPASLIILPVTTLALAVGIFLLLLGWVPLLGTAAAWLLDHLLSSAALISQWGAMVESLSRYVVGPATWWVIGLYIILLLPYLAPRWAPFGRNHLALAMAWIVLGVGNQFFPESVSNAYHQLAVGHGNAAVLRSSSGRTILLDAGSLSGPAIASRTIAPFLWHSRVRSIDAVFISHADIDHFNALPELVRRFSIGQVWVAPSFMKSKETAVRILLDELEKRRIPIGFLNAGDNLSFDDIDMAVLHPEPAFHGETDNASSLVFRIEAEGGSILSTGDLADDGLELLLSKPLNRAEVFIAPHHGSKSSNSTLVAQWAKPRLVVISEGSERRTADVAELYRREGARVVRTSADGAVSLRWRDENLWLRTFHGDGIETPIAADDAPH